MVCFRNESIRVNFETYPRNRSSPGSIFKPITFAKRSRLYRDPRDPWLIKSVGQVGEEKKNKDILP